MRDHNCFIGSWPFYRLDRSDLVSLRSQHADCGVDSGYLSSLQSVFYNDFYESEEELAREIGGSGYLHTVTVNPTVQGYRETLERCFADFAVKGIRLVPGYHGYTLSDGRLEFIKKCAAERNIPIFVNARLIDERMTHMIHPSIPTVEEMAGFARSALDITVVLCYLKENEFEGVYRLCGECPRLYFDTSGTAGGLLGREAPDYSDKLVLGTAFPLRSVCATVMRIEREADESLKKRTV